MSKPVYSPRFVRDKRVARSFAGGVAGWGLPMILLAFAHARYWPLLMFGFIGVANVIDDAGVYSALQQVIPPRSTGRASTSSGTAGPGPAGTADSSERWARVTRSGRSPCCGGYPGRRPLPRSPALRSGSSLVRSSWPPSQATLRACRVRMKLSLPGYWPPQDVCTRSCRRQRHPLRPDLIRRPHHGPGGLLPLRLYLPLTSRLSAGFSSAWSSGVARAGRKREGRAGRSRSRCHSQTTPWRRGSWLDRRGSRCRRPARRRVRQSRTRRRSGVPLDCRWRG
jgi:hypothetical protein